MRSLRALLSTALVAAAFIGIAPTASATTTWAFPDGTYFTVQESLTPSETATITIKNLSITDGSASGYVAISTTYPRAYSCSSQVFSGTSAQFVTGSYAPCTGSINFSLNPTTGVLTASASVTIGSRQFAGPVTGSVTAASPSVSSLTNCALTYDAAGQALKLTFDPAKDASTYDAVISGSGNLTLPDHGDPTGTEFLAPIDLITLKPLAPGSDLAFTVDVIAKRSDGATVATCTTSPVTVPGLKAPTITSTVPVTAGGLLTVNYAVVASPVLQGIEYRIDNGPWTRPGGTPPVNGSGGSFTLSGITAKNLTVTLRAVSSDATGLVTIEGTPVDVSFPSAPTKNPSTPSRVAQGSNPSKPVLAPPAQPTSVVAGTSNGAGTGTNGAVAANTGDAGIDAPCLAKDGTLYPTMYSTVGSQLTMAPNTHGMAKAVSFTVAAGALAPGLQLDRTYGIVFGVPTSQGSWVTTIRAKFANGTTTDSQVTTRIDADAQNLQYASQNIGSVGSAISIAPTTNAPIAGTTYKLVCGVLPAGTRLDARTGRILGTPTAPVPLPVPLRIAETSSTGKAAASFIFVVNRAGVHNLSYPAHPHARVGKLIRIHPTVSDAGAIAEFRTWIGKLPSGLHLNHRTGVISGRIKHPGRTHTITMVAQTKGGALLTALPMRITLR